MNSSSQSGGSGRSVHNSPASNLQPRRSARPVPTYPRCTLAWPSLLARQGSIGPKHSWVIFNTKFINLILQYKKDVNVPKDMSCRIAVHIFTSLQRFSDKTQNMRHVHSSTVHQQGLSVNPGNVCNDLGVAPGGNDLPKAGTFIGSALGYGKRHVKGKLASLHGTGRHGASCSISNGHHCRTFPTECTTPDW